MTHSLTLTRGATEIDLTDTANGKLLLEYVPRPPNKTATEIIYASKNGVDINNVRFLNVTETIRVQIFQNVQTTINAIEEFFTIAEMNLDAPLTDKSYINLQLSGESDSWRSEIYTGNLELSGNALQIWANGSVEIIITLTRAYYWEGSESEIPLNNSSVGSKTTGGIVITNDASGSNENHIDIVSGDITGALPTPAKIICTNTEATDRLYAQWYFGNDAFGDPFNYDCYLSGEGANGKDGTGTGGSYSTGNYGYGTLSAGPSYEQLMYWHIGNTKLSQMKGRYYRIVCVRALSVAERYIQFRLYLKNPATSAPGVKLADGPEKLSVATTDFADMGALQFPPNLVTSSYSDVSLAFWGRNASGSGQVNTGIDHIFLLPTDSFMKVIQHGFTVEQNEYTTFDGIDKKIYITESTGRSLNSHTVMGSFLMLFPNRNQRVFIVTDEDFDSTMEVQIYYRPRRLTI